MTHSKNTVGNAFIAYITVTERIKFISCNILLTLGIAKDETVFINIFGYILIKI